MTDIKITAPIKIALVKGVINSYDSFNTQYNKVFNLLLNLDCVKKIVPFNFLRNKNEVTDNSGIFLDWLAYYDKDDYTDAVCSRRLSRAVNGLSNDYCELLPHDINGSDSFAILFRVFFIPFAELLAFDAELRNAIDAVRTILRTILWLELISKSPKYINTASDVILTLFEMTGPALITIMNNEHGSTKEVLTGNE